MGGEDTGEGHTGGRAATPSATGTTGATGTTPHPVATAPPPPGVAASGAAASEPTRYLCAAVQMDGPLTERVVRDILWEEHRSIAASPDVDLVTVLKHAIAANTRRSLRDIGLFVALVLLVWMFLLGYFGTALLVWYFSSLAVVCAERFYTHHAVLAKTLGKSTFRPADAPDPGAYWLPALRQVASQRSGNVTVYSGYSPFVGYGVVLDSWSFALDTTKPAIDGGTIEDFTVHEVHDHVAEQVGQLDCPGLEVGDRLIVNGHDIRYDARFLPDPTGRPVFNVDPALIRDLTAHPEDRARPYLAVRVVSWEGELSFTVFLRFTRSESYLFVEASYSLLPPLKEAYHAVDSLLPTPTVGEALSMVRRSVLPTFRLAAGSPGRLLHVLSSPVVERTRRSRQRRQLERNPTFDYGALISLREAASDNQYQRYFQRLDKDMYMKVIERRIFDALVDFFDAHGIATDDLVQRQTTILNHGVLVTGQGTLNAGSVAAGPGSRAMTVVANARAAMTGPPT